MMPVIVVSPIKTIGEMAGRHKSREMISLLAEKQDFHRPGIIDPRRHLTIGVNDIEFTGEDGLVAPDRTHVDAIIDFVRGWDRSLPLLIHCWMGVSRSPAAALIAALTVSPEFDDLELAKLLRKASPQSSPNRRLIELGDAALRRQGRLIEAVAAIGRGTDYVGDQPFKLAW